MADQVLPLAKMEQVQERARDVVAKLPGIKEDALVKLGNCVICGQPQLGKDITFYCVTIERGAFSRDALQRRVGLGMMIGDALARHMGPNDDLAKVFGGPHRVFVHETCAGMVGHLLQLVPESDDAEASNAP